jgi:hypothetical protein
MVKWSTRAKLASLSVLAEAALAEAVLAQALRGRHGRCQAHLIFPNTHANSAIEREAVAGCSRRAFG